jgi:hypothetical protein
MSVMEAEKRAFQDLIEIKSKLYIEIKDYELEK